LPPPRRGGHASAPSSAGQANRRGSGITLSSADAGSEAGGVGNGGGGPSSARRPSVDSARSLGVSTPGDVAAASAATTTGDAASEPDSASVAAPATPAPAPPPPIHLPMSPTPHASPPAAAANATAGVGIGIGIGPSTAASVGAASTVSRTAEELVVPPTRLQAQLLDAVAEDAAIEDLYYQVDQALQNGRVTDLDAVLKEVRDLARRQFRLRAIARKIDAALAAEAAAHARLHAAAALNSGGSGVGLAPQPAGGANRLSTGPASAGAGAGIFASVDEARQHALRLAAQRQMPSQRHLPGPPAPVGPMPLPQSAAPVRGF
jgi:hypothetical protein